MGVMTECRGGEGCSRGNGATSKGTGWGGSGLDPRRDKGMGRGEVLKTNR